MPDARPSPDSASRSGPRVLIVRLGAMGDVIHALPAAALLREALPEARIGWLIEERWRELLCAPGTALAENRCPGRPLIDEVHPVDTRAWRKRPFSPAVQRAFLSVVGRVRSRRYDCALDFQGAIKSALLARLSGARLVVGFRQTREAPARLFYGKQVETRAAHVIEQNLELVQAWLEPSCPTTSKTPHLPTAGRCGAPATRASLLPQHPPSEARIDSALESMGFAKAKLAILNPGAGWAAKQWSAARYGALALALAARGLRPVVNYGPQEDILASEVAVFSRGIAKPLRTSLSEFVALARRADLFVGGDTGPMHLAALLGVRTVALFGPTDPARNGPYWPAARLIRDPASTTSYSHRRTSDPGLNKLSVERVLAEVDALLQN
jgi:lipopolysaccharide heptosyltransferase I